MYMSRHTLNSVESNFRLNCNLFMSNVTLIGLWASCFILLVSLVLFAS